MKLTKEVIAEYANNSLKLSGFTAEEIGQVVIWLNMHYEFQYGLGCLFIQDMRNHDVIAKVRNMDEFIKWHNTYFKENN